MLKDRIKNLISLIEDTEIEEIEVSSFWGAQKVRLSKGSKTSVSPSINDFNQETKAQELKKTIINEEIEFSGSNIEKEINKDGTDGLKEDDTQNLNIYEVKAPLVGTYYSSSKPSAPPFVNVGDKIKKGDTICIIEAMKIFNEIESDVSGLVTELCVENGNPVEFDQSIIKVSID